MLWFLCDVFAREGDATGRVVTRLAEALAAREGGGRMSDNGRQRTGHGGRRTESGEIPENENDCGKADTRSFLQEEAEGAEGCRPEEREGLGERLSTWGGGIGAVAVKPTRAVAGVRVGRAWATTFHKSRAWLLGLNLLTTTAAYVLTVAMKARRGDVVVLVTSPRLLPRPVARVARWRGARVIVLVHDVYPDVFAAVGWLKPGSWLFRQWNRWFVDGCRLAERVVVLGKDMQALLQARLPGREERVVVIPNWGEVERLRVIAKEDSPVTKALGLDGRWVIGVGGTLGRTHDANFVVELATRLQSEPRVVFLIYASGVGRVELDEQVRRRALTNVRLAPPCAPEELEAWLAAADVMLIPFRAGMAGISVPSRMYNIFAAGRPLLVAGDETSEAACVLREEQIGWAVAAGDTAGAEAVVREMVARPREAAERGAKARALAARVYTFEQHVRAWERVIEEVAAGKLAQGSAG